MQVYMKCAQIYIDIYNANTSKFKYIFILELFVAVRLVTFLRHIPSQTLVVVSPSRGVEEAAQTFLAGQRIGYLHQYLYISQWTHAKLLSVVSPIPHKYSDIECH